jgi:hypothetical protein
MQSHFGIKEFESPVKLTIQSAVSGKIHWENILIPGSWTFYAGVDNTISKIERDGETLLEFVWDTFLHGDLAHQYMMLWSMENKGAFGIAVGTHNGETGEWVQPIRKGMIEGFLVEASNIQFTELVENYGHLENCKLINSLITTKAGDFTFWESEEASFVNSIKKDHVEKFTADIKGKLMSSISLNDLMDMSEKKVRWLHLDVEGIDIDLIMSLSQFNLKSLRIIVYETLNSSEREKNECRLFLEKNGFTLCESGWNTIAVRNQ